MNIERHNGTLSISGLRELCASNARSFRDETRAALDSELKTIEIDLSQAGFVDSSGLGALVSLYKAANQRNHNGGVTVRLLHPPAPVQQVLELTRMHHLFEIVQRNGSPSHDPGPAQAASEKCPSHS
jgi:anti-sigma B factor antagonist